MELIIGGPVSGRTYMVEVDEGTESLSRVRGRLAVYRDCPHAVLFVAPTPSRAAEVLRLTDNPRVYASSLGRCLADPWGAHWRNGLGEAGRVDSPVADARPEGRA